MALVGLAAYSFPFSCGFARRGESRACETPLDAFQLARVAAEHGLQGIETPFAGMLPDTSIRSVDRLRDTLADAGLGIVVDTGVLDIENLETVLPLAARVGARVVRGMVSNILEGARYRMPGGWETYLVEMGQRIAAIVPLLEANDLVLALENHQDTTSDELIRFCEVGGPHIGITLDVANPLAVAEDPLLFARKVGPWIRNVHLKDYHIFPTSSGYQLVRCALGQGVIQFPELFEILDTVAPDAPRHIELAALYARHIRLLENEWWDSFPSRDVRDVLPALRVAARYAQATGTEWRTPWEQEAPPDDVGAYERAQFHDSVRFLQSQGVI
jgi:3-oxoisoapionate decarboxylase